MLWRSGVWGLVRMQSVLAVIAISFGGILGANARYFISLYVAERLGTAFPYGTFIINVSGSLVIGFFVTLITERFAVDPLFAAQQKSGLRTRPHLHIRPTPVSSLSSMVLAAA